MLEIGAPLVGEYLLHPLRGLGYQWWSGVGSDIGEITLLGLAIGAYKHINCEEPHCWRFGHRHPGHGRPTCRKHYHTVEPPPLPRPSASANE